MELNKIKEGIIDNETQQELHDESDDNDSRIDSNNVEDISCNTRNCPKKYVVAYILLEFRFFIILFVVKSAKINSNVLKIKCKKLM